MTTSHSTPTSRRPHRKQHSSHSKKHHHNHHHNTHSKTHHHKTPHAKPQNKHHQNSHSTSHHHTSNLRPHSKHQTPHSTSQHHIPHSKPHKHHQPSYSTSHYTPISTTTPTQTTSTRPRGYPKPLGPGRGFPIISRRFLHNSPRTYTIPLSSPPQHTLHILDEYRRPVFQLDRNRFCFHETWNLSATGSPKIWLRIRGFFVSARTTLSIMDGKGREVLLLQRMLALCKRGKVVHGFAGKVGGKPDLVVISEGGKRKMLRFRDRWSNDVASVEIGSRGEGIMSVSPGYDTALFIMCAVCAWQTGKG